MTPCGSIFALNVIFECFVSCFGLSTHPRLLVVSFDGFWYGYLDLYKDVVPNMLKLARKGITTPWMENQFITKTFPNHFSIATGLYEESHGIVANEFYDPLFNETFYLNDTEAKWWDTPVLPVWVLNQQQDSDRYSGGMMWPGTDAVIGNQTASYVVPYDPFVPYERKIDDVLGWFANVTRPANCVFLYFDEPDRTGHEHGPNSTETKRAVARTDEIVGYLSKRMSELKLRDKVNVILTSDHGMAEIKPSDVIDVDRILNHSYTKYGSSPVWAIYPDSGKEQFVYETFKNMSSQHNIVVYKKNEIPRQYHYRNNRRIPPILLVAREGYDFYTETQNPNRSHAYGNHGYNNSVASMHPFFIAYGPAFKSGAVFPPFKNVDLYPLMCHILKLTPEANNGSLANVIRMLRDPFGARVTGIWLIVICILLILCIILAITAAVATATRHLDMEPLDSGRFIYRTRKGTSGRQPTVGEENTYLLVPTAVDEV